MVDLQILLIKMLFILSPLNFSASNDDNMVLQGCVEEQISTFFDFFTNYHPWILLTISWQHKKFQSLWKLRRNSQLQGKLLRIDVYTWQSTLGELISSHHRA